MLASIRKQLWQGGVVALFAALLIAIPQSVSADEVVPTLQWSAMPANRYVQETITSPQGDTTEGCDGTNNLTTHNSSGQLVRNLDINQYVDGVENCIWNPVVDKNGILYGQPWGQNSNGNFVAGSNLLAYDGNTLKWKYPTGCNAYATNVTVGADGNIYFINGNNRLIGLTPDIQPPLTQPAKVLDVPSSGRCGDDLHASKSGIVVVSNMYPTFYSYSGQNLGWVNKILSSGDQISASGQFFYATYIASNGLRSVKVSSYDPSNQQVVWERIISANGAYVYGADLHSMPDGGVLAVLSEKKLDNGVQTDEQVSTLIKLDAAGNTLWSNTLPNETADGSIFESGGDFIVDSNGSVVIVRNGTITTSGNTGKGISIGVFAPNGDIVYDEIMHGNLNSASGPIYGFRNSGDPALWTDTLFIKATCQGSCATYRETKLYPIAISGLGMDYPRGTVLTSPAPVEYVAMGDSYSSGEGVEPFDPTTNTAGNQCHRSHLAYARIISGNAELTPTVGVDGFVACSGATTYDVLNANTQNSEAAQIDKLGVNTEIVTITIGGNDMGFVPFGEACVLSTCDFNSTAYATALDKINNDLPTALEATYQAILDEAPNAEIYVLDYPQVAPIKSPSDGFDLRCGYLYDGDDPWGDARAARDIVARLNSQIETSIAIVQQAASSNARLHYVEVNGSGSPFEGHTVCSDPGESYFNNLDQWVGHPAYALHPNARGQQAYATLVVNALA